MIKPTGTNVFVTEAQKETTTESGIILTGEVETGAKPGLVQAIGNEVQYVNPGDSVYLRWDKALPVSYDGIKGALVDYSDILAVF